jgi:hypothetical protein
MRSAERAALVQASLRRLEEEKNALDALLGSSRAPS